MSCLKFGFESTFICGTLAVTCLGNRSMTVGQPSRLLVPASKGVGISDLSILSQISGVSLSLECNVWLDAQKASSLTPSAEKQF